MKEKELVFIPAYNCEKQIGRVLAQFTPEICKKVDALLVINNRSSDATEEKALEAAKFLKNVKIKVIRNDENYGLGGSQKIGFQYGIDNGYEYVTVLHGDDQGNIKDLYDFMSSNNHKSTVDALLGARFMPGSSTPGYSAFRVLGNHIFNLIFSVACGKKLYDLGSGLNRYRTEALKDRYFLKFPDNLTFNYAMILAHCIRKENIIFFPLEWREDDQISNVKIFRQSFSVLLMLLKYFMYRKDFIIHELRDISKSKYSFKVVYENE